MKKYLLLKPFFFAILFPIFIAANLHGDNPTSQEKNAVSKIFIKNVEIKLLNVEDFQRLSEFFTHKENASGQIILRSQPDNRKGLYFIVFLNRYYLHIPSSAYVQIDYIKQGKPITHSRKFPLNNTAQNLKYCEAYFGITGSDWEATDTLSAWTISIKDANGANLIQPFSSFLWNK